MILRTTQIVQNDILMEEIMSAHDHLTCKCNTSSVKKMPNKTLEWGAKVDINANWKKKLSSLQVYVLNSRFLS